LDEFLRAHLGDMIARCEKGESSASGFLNPAEQYEAEKFIKQQRAPREIVLGEDGCIVGENDFPDGGYIFWGGYDTAERKRLFTLPAYLFYMASDIKGLLSAAFDDDPIPALVIRGSGYAKLSHRDYLGALLNCGIKRESLGDIVCASPDGTQSDSEAVVFALPAVAGMLCDDSGAPESVGRDKVKISRVTPGPGFGASRQVRRVDGVIASPRLDCAIGLLCGISREKAKTAVQSGIVQLNYEAVMSPDKEIDEGDIISVRGYGRFRIESFEGKTKKDRLRIGAVKYI